MKRISTTLDKKIADRLIAEALEREKNHTPSGKLSASKLWWPLQWQILYVLGVPQKELDEYTLRKFARGRQVEDWYISQIPTVKKQEFVEYRGVVGYYDALSDTSNWDFNFGEIPHEVKSVTNFKYRRIVQENAPQESHEVQSGFYALALEKEHHALTYIASDDLRTHTFVLDVADVKGKIDKAIDDFEGTLKSKIIPTFEPREEWQSKPKYANYPEWMGLSEKDLVIKAKELYGNS